MILPSKFIPEEQALLGVGATLLRHLKHAETVSSLWEKARNEPNVGTFERFVLALDLLFMTGLVSLSQGLLRRDRSHAGPLGPSRR